MASLTAINDFSDRLSPMVVKELRQGLRTRMFGGVMLVLHALLVIITLMGGASTDVNGVKEVMNNLIFFVLCVIYPLTAFSAVAGEIKANTMDMLVLTKLSAWSIVLGKWTAVTRQSLLVTISLVPYIVARYIYGGMELVSDLISLGGMWMYSAVLTAGVVAVSTQKHYWIRALILGVPLVVIMVGSLSWMMVGIIGSRLSSSSSLSSTDVWGMVVTVIVAAWLIFALLSFAATRIAPAASMISVVKRLTNLGFILALLGVMWLTNFLTPGKEMLFVVLMVACVDALTERVQALPSVYLPFYRRGWLGRIAGWFLVPGWMHGFFYTLLLVAIGCVASGLMFTWGSALQLWLSVCCLWFAALCAQLLSFRRSGDYLAVFCCGLFFLYVLSMFIWIIMTSSSMMSKSLDWTVTLLPSTALWRAGDSGYEEASLVVSCLWPVLLIPFLLSAFRQTRAARQEARQFLKA